MTEIDRTREHLIETYRKKAKHYDITSHLYPAAGYPQRTQRRRAVQELGLRPGDTVIDIACGTGLNFPLVEELVGPGGRIVGVDLTDAMLTQAQHRITKNGWGNIGLVQADAVDFDFPTDVDAILSTYALTQVPECAEVIVHGAAALAGHGRWVVLDLKVPDNTPGWLARLGTAAVRPFASIDEWITRRPWEVIRTAMRHELADHSWTELFFGTAFLAEGSRSPRTCGVRRLGSQMGRSTLDARLPPSTAAIVQDAWERPMSSHAPVSAPSVPRSSHSRSMRARIEPEQHTLRDPVTWSGVPNSLVSVPGATRTDQTPAAAVQGRPGSGAAPDGT